MMGTFMFVTTENSEIMKIRPYPNWWNFNSPPNWFILTVVSWRENRWISRFCLEIHPAVVQLYLQSLLRISSWFTIMNACWFESFLFIHHLKYVLVLILARTRSFKLLVTALFFKIKRKPSRMMRKGRNFLWFTKKQKYGKISMIMKDSVMWTGIVSNMECYTLRKGEKYILIKNKFVRNFEKLIHTKPTYQILLITETKS